MKISRTAGWLIALTVGGCSGTNLTADRLPDSSPNPVRSPESVFYLTKLPAAVSPISLDVSQAPLEWGSAPVDGNPQSEAEAPQTRFDRFSTNP